VSGFFSSFDGVAIGVSFGLRFWEGVAGKECRRVHPPKFGVRNTNSRNCPVVKNLAGSLPRAKKNPDVIGIVLCPRYSR
jgi:hypothetical protein